MSKKIAVTVPDMVGHVIKNMAIAEGDKLSTVAAFVLNTAIREGIQVGKYPAEWMEPPEEKDVDDDEAIPLSLVKSLADGEDSAVMAIADRLRMPPHELMKKLRGRYGVSREKRKAEVKSDA